MRKTDKRRGNSSNPARAKRRTGTFGGSTSESLLTEVRALARGERLPRPSPRGSGKPNVVNFPSQPRPKTALARNETAWCGIFCAAILSRFGIQPPFDRSNELRSFMWADAWLTDHDP